MAVRKIIHIDMDAFFAAIEQRDNPALQGRPVAVGGDPSRRGVVATASYEARVFGIHSAMAMATAMRRCPALTVIKPRIDYYRQISQQIRQIFISITPRIEPLSIDEAYLDVTDCPEFQGSATLMAKYLLEQIYQQTQLTASAGVSYCKFLAKYASDINKPNGLYTIKPEEALVLIANLPVGQFYGIGPATEKKLKRLGINTGKDLRQANPRQLRQLLGKNADFYYQLAHGVDNRLVQRSRLRQSIGHEMTFDRDTEDRRQINYLAEQLLQKAWQLLEAKGYRAKTLTVKIKYADFTIKTRSHTPIAPIASLTFAQLVLQSLLHPLLGHQAVRLVGVSFSQLTNKPSYPTQGRLFD